MGVVLPIMAEGNMRKQQENQALAELRRMTDKERQLAIAYLKRMNANKPALPDLKLVVGGR